MRAPEMIQSQELSSPKIDSVDHPNTFSTDNSSGVIRPDLQRFPSISSTGEVDQVPNNE